MTNTPLSSEDYWVTVNKAVELRGFSRHKLFRLRKENKIKWFKDGDPNERNGILINLASLDAYIAAHTYPANQ